MSLFQRLVRVVRPEVLNREIDDELEFHRQMRLRKASEQGLSPAEADSETKRRMGNLTLAREQMRDARVVGWLSSSIQDLRHGVILLRRDAGFSALIVLVLALGIGGNAAIFTLLKAAFLDPLPFQRSDRLVTLAEPNGARPSASEFLAVRERSQTLEQAALMEHRDLQLTVADEPVRVYAARVSASFFPLLGVNASLGRTLREEENQPGSNPVVVLTDNFWRSRLGADPQAVGRTLRIDGSPAVVAGVLPPDFHFDYPTLRIPEPVEMYVSLAIQPAAPFRGGGAVQPTRVLARLRDGSTVEQAEADLRRLGQALAEEHPAAYRNRDGDTRPLIYQAVPLRAAIVGPQQRMLWLILGGAGILLLIACANTAQLLLARSLRRGREVAIRTALGANRFRLIRQFLLEGFALAACGGLCGLAAAGPIARLLVAMLPVRSPLLESAHVDMRAMLFTLGLCVLSTIVFATIPAIKGSQSAPGAGLGSRTSTGESNRWRNAMLALEAALSVFLLCGAGLVAQNLWTLLSSPMGFDPNHVLVMRLKAPSGQPIPREARPMQEYLEKIAALPGIDSAATVTGPPLRPSVSGPTELVGVKSGNRLKTVIADNHLVSPSYFQTLRIPLLAGRMFRDSDAEPWRVAIVNQEFARRFGFGRDIVGKQIFEPGQPMTIIGMVGNVRTRGLQTEPVPEVYLASLRFSWTSQYLVVRSAIPPEQLMRQVKAAIQSANSEQAVYGIKTMDEMISDAVTEPRFHVFLIGAFALLAVAMAAAGMYSVISCLVAQRTSEIAIRLALGAGRRDIVRTIMGKTTAWVAAGLAGGLALGLATRNLIRTLSNTATEGSPWMYALVLLLFLAVTWLASYVPMRRAGRLDPAIALRSE